MSLSTDVLDYIVSIPFKDSMGRWRTQSLFYEYNGPGGWAYKDPSNYLLPIYNMKDEDSVGTDPEGNEIRLLSFKRLFIELGDPTWYTQATTLLGGMKHWQKCLNTRVLSGLIEECQEELEWKMRSEALKKATQVANSDSSQAFNAQKYLAEKGWEPKKGRPTKAQIEKEARIKAKTDQEVHDDMKRVGLTLVKGDKV